MPLQLTKTYPRLWSLEAGVAMVVTDLHGDWDRYVGYRDHSQSRRGSGPGRHAHSGRQSS